MLASMKALLSSVIDYAGLFPPAKLNLEQSMANYDRYRTTAYNWMLGRFVLPASRLDEFAELLSAQWPLSIIISRDIEADIEKVRSLSNIATTSLEFPPLSSTEIEKIIPYLPDGVDAFFEIPFQNDLEPYLSVLNHTPASAKIRTGGVTVDAFPRITQVCNSIFAFAQAQVSFKATAGLHHPLRGKHPLTYEPDSPTTIMHGFLNVAVAAALIYHQKITLETAQELLQESSHESFQFASDNISWHNYQLNIAQIKATRQKFFRSFGSCSFQQPIDELTAIFG